ncbi:MAG TPA: peptidoglycan recognition family protein [Caulobacteraceae bacterium]|jgi:N-acetyl-anhydromuramyl-L-alanine amidase AmpD
MQIEWVGAHPGNFSRGRPGGRAPTAVVLHIMDGTLVGNRAWFNDSKAVLSAHYGVGKTGIIHQYVRETDTAYHAGIVIRPAWSGYQAGVNPNYQTIGIEHEGFGDVVWPWPQAQLDASMALVHDICARWGIPLDPAHITTHHSIRASKPCPGVNFRLNDYIARLGAAAAPAAGAAPVAQAAPPAVKLLARARLRRGPTTASQILRVLDTGETFNPAGRVRGEPVGGNPVWYRDGAGRHLWSGATDHPGDV